MFKLERYLFYLLIFSIPFQTRVFLWSLGVVEGFNEWQSVFLYGTDLIIITLFGLWFFRSSRKKRVYVFKSQLTRSSDKSLERSRPDASLLARPSLSRLRELFKRNTFFPALVFLFTFLFFAFISIFFAPYEVVGAYRFIKLLEFVGLFFYTAHTLKSVKFEKVSFAFAVGGVFQSIIAITQFFLQRSLGLKLLGEASLSVGRQDVAEFVAYGARFMRAYGTFPSPNVLAAYLALSFLFLVTWFMLEGEDRRFSNGYYFVVTGTVLIVIALLFTFSRAVIVACILSIIFYFSVILFSKKLKEYRKKAWQLIVPLITSSLVFVTIYWPEVYSRALTLFEFEDSALRERVFFNNLSYELINFNFFGVGIGNYTLALRDVFGGLREGLYQPVHNIFLLSAAEVGWIGAALFIVFLSYILVKSAQRFHKEPDPIGLFVLTSIFFIVVSGFFDHFYLTLQQGGLMLWLILGIGYFYIKFKTSA